MRSKVSCHLTLVAALSLWPGLLLAQQAGLTRYHDPWGRFSPGAWKTVRVTTETFEEDETVTSITETRTTLKKIDDGGVTLQGESAVEVVGKQIGTDPQTVKQGFHGELITPGMKVKDLGTGEVSVGGQPVFCRMVQLVVEGPTSRTTTRISYSDVVAPYVLKRHIIKTDLEGKTVVSETTVELTALEVPCRLLKRGPTTAHFRTVHQHARGTVTTTTVTSTDVPGGVVCAHSKEVNSQGKLIRRSTLELVDYGYQIEIGRPGLFGPRRLGRTHRPYRITPYRYRTLPSTPQ